MPACSFQTGKRNTFGSPPFHQQHIGELKKRRSFSEQRRGNVDTRLGKLCHRRPQQQHDIPAHDDDGDPRRNEMDGGQRDESGCEKQFISQRVEKGAQTRPLIGGSRNGSIKRIGHTGQN